MGIKLLWVGLTIFAVGGSLPFQGAALAGAIIMVIGCVLMLLDK